MSDALLSVLERNSRDFSQINKRLRARLDHRTPSSSAENDLDRMSGQLLLQQERTSRTAKTSIAPSQNALLSLFSAADEDDGSGLTDRSSSFIPPLRNTSINSSNASVSSIENPVSSRAFQSRQRGRHLEEAWEWPYVPRGKRQALSRSFPVATRNRGTQGSIADGQGQAEGIACPAGTEKESNAACEDEWSAKPGLEHVKKRLWSSMFEAVDARISRSTKHEEQGGGESFQSDHWNVVRRHPIKDPFSKGAPFPHRFPSIEWNSYRTTNEKTDGGAGAADSHLTLGSKGVKSKTSQQGGTTPVEPR